MKKGTIVIVAIVAVLVLICLLSSVYTVQESQHE